MSDRFRLLDPDKAKTRPPESLMGRESPRDLSDHRKGARFFVPSPDLVEAVNIALAVEAPLLLTGEPGTGKTQVAFYLAYYFGIEDALYSFYVRSNTRAEDLLYQFDDVAYFHASQDPERKGQPIDKKNFRRKGPLWEAYESEGPAIVLIDEVDKAPRDFPNDLLNVLDQHRFEVPVTGEKVEAKGAAPLVVITSNSERRLPEPFLRRVIFHNIRFDDALLQKAVKARAGRLGLSEEVLEAALLRFGELRGRNLRKKPATAELLVWLAVLSGKGDVDAESLRSCPARELPALAALVKDREDLDAL
jgi:MoxR-like ATPase